MPPARLVRSPDGWQRVELARRAAADDDDNNNANAEHLRDAHRVVAALVERARRAEEALRAHYC